MPQGVALADVNLDGIVDIVVANYQSSDFSLFLGNGGGTFGAPLAFGGDSPLTSIVVADFNHDGKPDVVGSGHGGTLTEFLHL